MPVGHVATSSIAQPVGSQTRPTILSRASVALQKLFFTAASIENPDGLYRVLHLMQQNVALVVRVLASNPTLSCNVLTGESFSSGATRVIPHGLGRAYHGFYPLNAQGAAPAIYIVPAPATEVGVLASQAIILKSDNTLTCDLLVY